MSRMNRDDRGSSQGNGNGVFIQEGVVKEIIDCDLFDKKEDHTMHYVVVVTVKKYESEDTYEKKLLMVGKMWKKGMIPTNIENMMYTLGIESGKVPDKEIDAFLDECKIGTKLAKVVIGKPIKFVDYRSSDTYEADGKTKYSTKTWNGSQPFKTVDGKPWKAVDTFDPATENAEIYKAFMTAVEENNTYIKYQADDDLSDDSTEASSGSSSSSAKDDEDFDI